MNYRRLRLILLAILCVPFAQANNIVTNYLKQRFNADAIEYREVESLRSRLTDGKLHLHIRDFIELMLKNSADVQLTRLDLFTAADQILSARSPFDPDLQANFSAQRAVTPLSFGGGFFNAGSSTTGNGSTGSGSTGNGSTGNGSTGNSSSGSGISTSGSSVSGLSGTLLPQTISSLNQTSSILYSQLLPTGQTISTSFNGERSSGDEYTFPAVFGQLNFQVTQPLLQGRTNLQARAPLTNARTALLVTSEESEAAIGTAIATAARQYWAAVQARDTIKVQEQTFALAQKSYDRDKLALDLGALASLDIYQSETQLAERKRDLITAQYEYRTELDGLRHFIGADLTPELRALEVILDDEASQTPIKSSVLPFEEALTKALSTRPDFKATDQRLVIDALNARVARDSLRPQLNFTVNGGSSGPSFNQVAAGGTVGIPATPYPGYGETIKQILAFDFPAYGVAVQLNFPFRNSAAKAQLSEALVSKVKDQYQKRSVQETITLNVRQAIDNIDLAEASINAAVIARDLARKNVDAEQQKYQLGTITAFELLDSQSRLASSESSVLASQVSYQQAFINYQLATWTLLDGFGLLVQVPVIK